jgi:hypothetical protein
LEDYFVGVVGFFAAVFAGGAGFGGAVVAGFVVVGAGLTGVVAGIGFTGGAAADGLAWLVLLTEVLIAALFTTGAGVVATLFAAGAGVVCVGAVTGRPFTIRGCWVVVALPIA